jgi:hypothetical protein
VQRHRQPGDTGRRRDRITAFTGGVFAVPITLSVAIGRRYHREEAMEEGPSSADANDAAPGDQATLNSCIPAMESSAPGIAVFHMIMYQPLGRFGVREMMIFVGSSVAMRTPVETMTLSRLWT